MNGENAPRGLGERPEVRTHEVIGITMLVLGLAAMIFPAFTTNLILAGIALILIIGGIVYGVLVYRGDKKNIAGWAKMALLIVFGVLIIAYPYMGAVGLTLIVFLLLLGAALISFYWAYKTREDPAWWAMAVSGAVALFLAILLIWGIFKGNPWLVGTYIGINLFVDGLMLILMGRYRK